MHNSDNSCLTMIQRAESILTVKAERDFARIATESTGAEFRRLGSMPATRLPELPEYVPYNKVRGYRKEECHRFKELTGFYSEYALNPSVEVWAADADRATHRTLLDAGLQPSITTAALHTRPRPSQSSIVDVQEVGLDDRRYMDVLYRGYDVPRSATAFRRMLAVEHSTPGLRRYIALIDGRAVSAAALFTDDSTSLLAGVATIPAYRKRGCQAALVERRLSDAAEHSDLAIATTAFASPSHANLARQGFHISHTRTTWN
ncbi:GNAT family N-acetyltransferase [Haloglycomyces albus]|uniref:GNAT family N-acetyltransferase n=1 Tax=Haloglycomyces albus TaxID=526067 RepID=UPI00046D0CA6|nr:GNAT family N-acetyltransferase [Haloglycomyces albus]